MGLEGVIVYGVPEMVENGVPLPQSLEACGIALPAGTPERVESILSDGISPPLPELSIRVLRIDGLGTGDSVLFIHHPASWNGPHMVSG